MQQPLTNIVPFVPRQRPDQFPAAQAESPVAPHQTGVPHNLYTDALCYAILETLPSGMLVIDQKHHLLYSNSKAQQLCRSLSHTHEELPVLPELIKEICDRYYATFQELSLIIGCLGHDQQMIRIQVKQIDDSVIPILILLENCTEKFKAEHMIECKKYALTERETEVWGLLKQGHTYQEIAIALTLSLNTIKTHAKHIHTKRRDYLDAQPAVWFSP